MSNFKYPTVIRPLSPDEGGGYLVEFPDLPGCVADGDTPEEALVNAEDALEVWLNTAKEFGDPIPEATTSDNFSGQWRLRIPKSLHATLVLYAKREGVSLNTYTATLLAKSVGLLSSKHC